MTVHPSDAPRPPIVDRAAFQAELDRLQVREKAHTREGDAIAATRRRLPMVEVDASTPLRRWQSQLLLVAKRLPHRPRAGGVQ